MKIICIGRNYVDHAKELNNPLPEEPLFFLKPDSAILLNKNPFFIPEFTKEVHYETELIVKISRIGKHIGERFAHKYYNEIGLGLDFTARDVQAECKKNGLPWEKAKAFDGSAVVGKFFPKEKVMGPSGIRFHLDKNGERVQDGNSSDMIFAIDQLIAYLSQFFTLKMGDLIFTGTPAGVGPVTPGDMLQGYLGDEEAFKVRIK